MNVQGPFIIFVLFMVRLALPLVILLTLGYLYERYMAPTAPSQPDESRSQPAASIPMSQPLPMAAQGYAATRPPCWEVNRCLPEMKAACPVSQRPGVPCWLTRQLVDGQLPDKCLSCSIFREGSNDQSYQHLV